MQAISVKPGNAGYDPDMQIGRPSNRPRTPFGERLLAARSAAGLSQTQVAEKLGITQAAYAEWERYPVALRPDQIEKLTEILKVSVEVLFGKDVDKRRNVGPSGKARRLFEAVSRMPRAQQQHVLTVVEAFVEKKSAG
jgi:transcriptional regulator with XRE-family HTH domain